MWSDALLTNTIVDEIHTHAGREYPRESCGLIIVRAGKPHYVPCRNIADDDAQFTIHPEDYAAAEDEGEVVCVAHSHPDTLPRPSEADRVSCESSGLPWVIVSYPHRLIETLEPTGYIPDLVGREFVHGVVDCYTLIRDYYRKERGITLPNFNRTDEWWLHGENLYEDNFRVVGFYQVPREEMREGDLLFMKIGSPVINHGAVYLGGNVILHHCYGRLSSRDVYGGFWQKATVKVVRYGGDDASH